MIRCMNWRTKRKRGKQLASRPVFSSLPRREAVKELLQRGGDYFTFGFTTLHQLFWRCDPSLELLKQICDVMKDDPLHTNLFALEDGDGWHPLHFCSARTTRVEVLQFAIDRYPRALLKVCSDGTPLQICEGSESSERQNYAQVFLCLSENTAKYPALRNQDAVKCCLARNKKKGMSAVVAAIPHNEQTPAQFVYELLDMMVNCEMKAMAEDIVSYVGIGSSIIGVHKI